MTEHHYGLPGALPITLGMGIVYKKIPEAPEPSPPPPERVVLQTIQDGRVVFHEEHRPDREWTTTVDDFRTVYTYAEPRVR